MKLAMRHLVSRTSPLICVVASVAAGLVLLTSALAQTPTFRAGTRIVVLEATVTNLRGELVTDLGRDDFAIYDNGRRQTITVFRRDDVPVSVGLVIDNSGSMRALRPTVEAAALAFVRASNPQDEVFVLNFADKSRVDVPLTSDAHALEAGIRRVDAIGSTAMRDAVDRAEHYLEDHARRERRLLLVITDGKDNASVTALQQIQRQADQDHVMVYAVGLMGNETASDAKSARRDLDELTQKTGGVAFYPGTPGQIQDTMIAIAHEVRNQYIMGFVPVGPLDGAYHHLRVGARGRERLTVRTREGYRATADALGSH